MNDGLALRASYVLSRIVFFVLSTLVGLRRAVVRDNLARSFPELDAAGRRLLRRAFTRRQSELAAEVFYAGRISANELRERVAIANPDQLVRAAPPRPLILAGSHHGNFEWALLRISLELGDRLLALYKPLHGEAAERWFHRVRSRFGARVVPAKSVVAQLAQFRTAASIGLVADQVPRGSPDRHWTEFLGQQTAFFMGPELLGRALRSQVLFIDVRRLAAWSLRAEADPAHTR